MGSPKATLAQVAKSAGVSSATASRVIRGTGPVSEEIRIRVEAAVANLGYEPRKSAFVEKTNEGVIAVLTGDLLNPFFPEVLRGVQDEVDNYGLTLVLHLVTDHPQRQERLVQKLIEQNINGAILMGTRPFPALSEWQQKESIPLVVINHGHRNYLPLVHYIRVDFENALYRATQHLINLNHTRFGYLSAFVGSDIAIDRKHGIELALKDAGLELPPESCVAVPPGTDWDGGFQAMNSLLDRPANHLPTAVLAFNDVVALGALHALRQRGVRVPQDMSVIGVDDTYASVYASPPLTTIAQPKFRMGVLSVQRLQMMGQSAWSSDNCCTILESPLIVRASTGPAPRS